MNIRTKFTYLFHDYEWLCAYRKNNVPVEKISGSLRGFEVVSVPKGFWASDPFLFQDREEIFLFVELANIKKKKCVLAVKKILPKEEENFHMIYEFPYHTSYPCVFEWNGMRYIIPETKSAKEIVLLECVDWPYEWKKKAVLMQEIAAADCTPYILGGQLRLLIYEEDKEINIYTAELDVEEGNLNNIKRLKNYREKVARPGGHMIYSDKGMLRVRQPGIKFYGEKIEFVECHWSVSGLDEEVVNSILPEQICLSCSKKIIGVHTYNRIADIEVIDVFIKKLNLIKPFLYVLHRLRMFGYGEYERDHKYIWKVCE